MQIRARWLMLKGEEELVSEAIVEGTRLEHELV